METYLDYFKLDWIRSQEAVLQWPREMKHLKSILITCTGFLNHFFCCQQ